MRRYVQTSLVEQSPLTLPKWQSQRGLVFFIPAKFVLKFRQKNNVASDAVWSSPCRSAIRIGDDKNYLLFMVDLACYWKYFQFFHDKEFSDKCSQSQPFTWHEAMNFLLNKKTKPQFALKSIENSNLFQRRASNTNCHIDNHEISRQLLINYSPSSGVDKSDKITNTTNVNSADNRTPNGTRFQTFSEISRDMETLGKAVTFEVNRGSVDY